MIVDPLLQEPDRLQGTLLFGDFEGGLELWECHELVTLLRNLLETLLDRLFCQLIRTNVPSQELLVRRRIQAWPVRWLVDGEFGEQSIQISAVTGLQYLLDRLQLVLLVRGDQVSDRDLLHREWLLVILQFVQELSETAAGAIEVEVQVLEDTFHLRQLDPHPGLRQDLQILRRREQFTQPDFHAFGLFHDLPLLTQNLLGQEFELLSAHDGYACHR